MNTLDQLQLQRRIGFLEGTIEGITLYAIWRNGEQKVGCMERSLKTVLQPYKDELAKLTALPPPAPPSEAVSPCVAQPHTAVIDPLSPHRNDPPGEPRGGLSGERGGGDLERAWAYHVKTMDMIFGAIGVKPANK